MAYTPYNPYVNPYGYQTPVIQQQQQIPQMQTPQQPQQQSNGLIWVSGEIGAKSYLIAPGNTVMLMDSESSKFYIKSTDGAGMPSIRTFEYKECIQNAPQALTSHDNSVNDNFITREEFDDLRAKYEELEKQIKKPIQVRAKKEVDNE